MLTAEPSPGGKGASAGDPVQADRSVQGDGAPVLFDGSEDGRLLPQLLDRLSDRALDLATGRYELVGAMTRVHGI